MPYSDPKKQREYAKKHYRQNKQRYLDRNRVNRLKLRKYINSIKETSPCTDCGINYPYYVMDFDHLSDKEGLIIQFVKANNRKKLEDEIAKCEIVCSNCHRVRSFRRMKEIR